MWPHVHLIPRREGDNPNPKGGVRNVIPMKGDYSNDEKQDLIDSQITKIHSGASYYDL